MSLESAIDLLARAEREHYAVGYFECWNLESLQGVIDAAETTRSPLFIGFNGEFLTHVRRRATEEIAWYGALGKAAAESTTVPCAFIFNECACDSSVRQAVGAGFNLVMPSDSHAPPEAYRARVTALAHYAHEHGVAVEAEVGALPYGGSGLVVDEGSPTDPTEAAEFIEATGADLLAVSIGNVHILVRGQQGLDLKRLAAIRKSVSTPLVLHGGTGINESSLRAAIELGISKVNYGTILKQRYLSAVRMALGNDNIDPHKLLGLGGTDDVMVAGRLAVRDVVVERMGLLGCIGRA